VDFFNKKLLPSKMYGISQLISFLPSVCLPGVDEPVEVPADRAARVSELAGRVHKAMMDKAKGDVVRFRLMAGSLMQEVLDITGYVIIVERACVRACVCVQIS
jgi:hypothetical protein